MIKYTQLRRVTIIDYLGKDSSSFIRKINDMSFIISKGEIIFKRREIKTNFIRKINKDTKLSEIFITFDIETRLINNIHSPYCASFFDGTKAWSFSYLISIRLTI